MSWLARSIANSLKLDDDDSDSDANPNTANVNSPEKSGSSDEPLGSPNSSSNQSPRGVKEDLTELKKTLTRQFWGVASFLAPPPDPSSSPTEKIADPNQDSPPTRDRSPSPQQPSNQEASDDEALIAGIRSDFAEIGGRFRTGISKLSNNKAVWEFTKIASNLLQLGSESDSIDEELVGNAVGVTEEVLAFARNIAMHPETWLDFPLPVDDDDSDDFDLSDAHQEHALAIERLAPRLSALRMELCPGYMSEGSFWKVYFVLLHPRLSKQDAELLSTQEIVEARAMLMQELHNQNKSKVVADSSERGTLMTETGDASHEVPLSVPPSTELKLAPIQLSPVEAEKLTGADDVEMDKHTVQSTEIQIVDKPVVEGPSDQTMYQPSHSESSSRVLADKYEDDADDWLKEETPEIDDVRRTTTIPIENDEDVSFSDLEEDDDDGPTSYKKVTYGSDSSTKDSRDWVQLGGSSDDSVKDVNTAGDQGGKSKKTKARELNIKESNDWLNVDDIDEV